jgi:hypothetical protein
MNAVLHDAAANLRIADLVNSDPGSGHVLTAVIHLAAIVG